MIKVLLPWNFSSYIPLNGFHPLYQSILEFKSKEIQFLTPSEISPKDYENYLDWKKSTLPVEEDFPKHVIQNDIKESWEIFTRNKERRNPHELQYLDQIESDIEFHHTAPFTKGEKPFIFHLESFIPLFFPFLQQGKKIDEENLDKVIPFFESLLSSKTCLAICSHLPETLDQIDRFFNNPDIGKKLFQSPISLSDEFICHEHIEKNKKLRALYIASAHQGDTIFLRGGYIALSAALTLLERGFDIEFVFRFPCPDFSTLEHHGICTRKFAKYNGKNIFWIDEILNQSQLNRLISTSHVMLLPSLNLHSVSIMSAMAHGTIPIVSDTYGVDSLVQNKKTGIILEGVKSTAWSTNNKYGILLDSQEDFTKCQNSLKEQLVEVLTQIYASPYKLEKMQKETRKNFQEHMNKEGFNSWIEKTISLSYKAAPENREKKDCHFKSEICRELEPSDFEIPKSPQPIRVDIQGSDQLYKFNKYYYFIPAEFSRHFENTGSWSPLDLAKHRYLNENLKRKYLFSFASEPDHISRNLVLSLKGEYLMDTSNTRFSDDIIPDYIHDFVIFQTGTTYHVLDCQSYHSGDYSNIVFSSASYNECRNYVLNIDSYVADYLAFRKPNLATRTIIRILLKTFKKSDIHGEIENTAAVKINYSGWMKPFADRMVGTHPVFEFTKFPPKGFFYNRTPIDTSKTRKAKNLISIIKTIIIYSYYFRKEGVITGDILRFWLTRYLSGQNCCLQPGSETIALYPTFLFLCPNHRWIVEIEDMLTLMYPFVPNGSFNLALNHDSAIIKIIGVMLTKKECVAILCHLEETAKGLKKIYQSIENIDKKIVHIPLGMPLIKKNRRVLKKKNEPLRILFMSSWAQDPRASYRRGLLNTLETGRLLKLRGIEFKMTIRCQLPRLTRHYQEILQYKEIDHIPHLLSEEDVRNLYSENDVLLFLAPRIAVTTLLKAMEHGMAIVASDGFGVEEYIHDQKNGLIAHGFHGKAGWIDDEGFFRENYYMSLQSQEEVCKNAVEHLEELSTNPSKLLTLQQETRKHVEQNHSINNWNEKFENFFSQLRY